MRTAELVNRKLPASKSGVSCTSGFAGTALRRDETRPAPHVAQRIDRDLPARGGEGDERLGDERHVARRAHRDLEFVDGVVATVGDHERDAPRRAVAAVLVEHDGAVGGRRHLVGALHRGGRQEERVAVWVDPVAEHRRRDAPAALDGGAVVALLHGRRVLLGVAHGRR